MKRRNFCMALVSAAAAVALPASAMRDILIHKGNVILPYGVSKAEAFRVMYGWTAGPYYCKPESLQQMNFYQHASRIAFSAHRQQKGKTNFLQLGNAYHAELEKRVLVAALNAKQKRA